MTARDTADSGKISGKNVARYVLLPEILPRVRELAGSGFGYLAFLIATVYNAVRILPSNHPYVQHTNIGTFNVRDVIAAAAGHIQIDKKNIDQIVIFFAVIAGLIILALQFFLMVIAIFSGQAFAQETGGNFDGLFATPNPTNDIAFMLLDHVFGIPELYGSKVLEGGQTPMHMALQALFRFYNLAILVVAVLIFLYFVLVVVAETAQTGTPFGQRFNTVYAPLRLVFAIGLLVPLNYGFNAAQYITLMTAKLGSGLATNGWTIYNQTLSDADSNPLGTDNASLIAGIDPPSTQNLSAFATVLHSCIKAYDLVYNKEIKGYVINGGSAQDFAAIDFPTAREITRNGNIHVVFGHEGSGQGYEEYPGSIRPYCGSAVIYLSARNPDVFVRPGSSGGPQRTGGRRRTSTDPDSIRNTGQGTRVGAEFIQDVYYIFAKGMLYGGANDRGIQTQAELIKKLGERFAVAYTNPGIVSSYRAHCHASDIIGDNGTCEGKIAPPAEFQNRIVTPLNSTLNARVERGVELSRRNADFTISQDILDRGWGGAGLWYNRVADANGALVAAIQGFPIQKSYPLVMQEVRKQKAQNSIRSEICETYSLDGADDQRLEFNGEDTDRVIAQGLNAAYIYWCQDRATEEDGLTENALWDAMHLIFGTNGLFDLRRNTDDNIHPLAQMTAVGRSLVESSIKNVMMAFGSSIGGGLAGAMGGATGHFGAALEAMSGFFVQIALIGLVAGFILFYILPFLPFIYFFFAVGAWVKTIFEAMVGAPLWALAHLRIDGDGFPGRAASSGYFLIFEILIRPILTVFGLIGGLAIFAAMAVILNELFNIVVFNLTGTDLTDFDNAGTGDTGSSTAGFDEFRRNIVDQFFFTIVYAVILYMMALSAFKMIDLVPNNILRWIGAGVSSFSDQAQDPKEGLIQYAAIGGYTIGQQLVGAGTKFGGAVGQTIGGVAAAATRGGSEGTGK